MRQLVFRLFVVGLAIIAGGARALAEKRVALVIGNSAYKHATPLKNPQNDANALAKVLGQLGFEVIKGVDLDRLQFEGTVRKFARAIRGADVALLFYAGHGLQVNGRNYLAPVNAKLSDEADLDFETLPVRTILKQMEREPRTNLVFLDACRDNPLARNLARGMGTRSAAIGRGLARVDTGVGTLIAFATQPGNVALDGADEHSPFVQGLLKHISTPGLEVSQLMKRVRQEVLNLTGGKQVPWDHSSMTQAFFFSPSAVKVAEPPRTSDDADSISAQKAKIRSFAEKFGRELAREHPGLPRDEPIVKLIDLNTDGRLDFIMDPNSSSLCGSGGCSSYVYLAEPNGSYRRVYSQFGGGLVPAVGPSETKGVKDLLFDTEIVGNKTLKRLVVWNGQEYVDSHILDGFFRLLPYPDELKPALQSGAILRNEPSDLSRSLGTLQSNNPAVIGKWDKGPWLLVFECTACPRGYVKLEAATPAPGPKKFVRWKDQDLPGNDISVKKGMTLDRCEAACAKNPRCASYTFNVNARWCFLKSGGNRRVQFKGAFSGQKLK